ncbi:hypothetical protein AB0J38_06880 [Streptomyces sp. NPDC050095]|uniref:hypothetical protein n=1 Tax=unclassified Streptomyces TaxID=2593676 RepID=UPI00343514DC
MKTDKGASGKVPVGYCDVCTALRAQRDAAHAAGQDGEVGVRERELETHGVPEPAVPVDGCGVCAGFADRRARARAAYDYSEQTDMNVRLRTHLEDEHGVARRQAAPS